MDHWDQVHLIHFSPAAALDHRDQIPLIHFVPAVTPTQAARPCQPLPPSSSPFRLGLPAFGVCPAYLVNAAGLSPPHRVDHRDQVQLIHFSPTATLDHPDQVHLIYFFVFPEGGKP